MILDLHVHSRFSGDSPVDPAEYADKIEELRRDRNIDGFVLMEHNHLVTPDEYDLEGLARERGMVILAGVEVDTFWGHVLVYGMDPAFWNRIKQNRKQEPLSFAREVESRGGMALIPSHPFRGFIGVGERAARLAGVSAVEGINGSNDPEENEGAINFAQRMGYSMTGGSDAHFVAELGKAVTVFEREVMTMADLVKELESGRFRPAPGDGIAASK